MLWERHLYMPHQGKIGRSIEMNNEFMVMDEEELLDVDGGAVWLVVHWFIGFS